MSKGKLWAWDKHGLKATTAIRQPRVKENHDSTDMKQQEKGSYVRWSVRQYVLPSITVVLRPARIEVA